LADVYYSASQTIGVHDLINGRVRVHRQGVECIPRTHGVNHPVGRWATRWPGRRRGRRRHIDDLSWMNYRISQAIGVHQMWNGRVVAIGN
jgi:hypothetical protein